MHVVDVAVGQVSVERRIDRSRTGVEGERAEGQEPHHLVFVVRPAIEAVETLELVHIERCEPVATHGADIAARAFNPEDLGGLTGQRIRHRDLGGGIAAAVIGDALVGTEQVRAVKQAAGFIESRGLGVVPLTLQESGTLRLRHALLPSTRAFRPDPAAEAL